MLLDQNALAGVGNIYADEALWRAKLHPLTPADALTPPEIKALHRAVRRALEQGSRGRARRCATTGSRTAAAGEMQHEFKVYGRGGEPCDRCGTPIDKIRVAGRGTWYCPTCQIQRAALDWAASGRADIQDREVVVLRSIRYGEADRILHLYSAERGRIGAIAKGVRKTKSRFGARLEPLSHVELMLHHGAGELHTITGVELKHSHHAIREEPYRLNVGLIGAEAMLRLHGEPEANERAFGALTQVPRRARRRRAERRPPAARPARCSRSS